MPTTLKANPDWLDTKKLKANKYTPVKVDGPTDESDKIAFQKVVQDRVDACRALALIRNKGDITSTA